MTSEKIKEEYKFFLKSPNFLIFSGLEMGSYKQTI